MTARCDRCGRFTDATAVVINRHMTGDGLEVNDYEVCRRCGYTVPGLTEMQARRFAAQHDEADGNFACWPEIERAES